MFMWTMMKVMIKVKDCVLNHFATFLYDIRQIVKLDLSEHGRTYQQLKAIVIVRVQSSSDLLHSSRCFEFSSSIRHLRFWKKVTNRMSVVTIFKGFASCWSWQTPKVAWHLFKAVEKDFTWKTWETEWDKSYWFTENRVHTCTLKHGVQMLKHPVYTFPSLFLCSWMMLKVSLANLP